MLKFWAEHPVLLGASILFGAGFIGAYPLPAVFVLTVVAAGIGLVRWLAWLDKRSNETIRRQWGLRRRADYEHWLVMNGDPGGMWGQFPPYV